MTLAEKAYVSLRKDIVEGCFAAESPLRLADLSKCCGMGFSPLREALNGNPHDGSGLDIAEFPDKIDDGIPIQDAQEGDSPQSP